MSVRILRGDCLDVLKGLPDESVHCIVSSPPYWRQRDYGMAGQLGLETTPEEYIDKLVAIFSQCRRILRADGTAWVNLGDKWASGGNGGGVSYKNKDLVGIPWMFAFAARAEGWYLRQCNVWAKPNGMPESVRDRSTVSHEYVFHLAKNNDYWYDTDAARTPHSPATMTQLAKPYIDKGGKDYEGTGVQNSRSVKARIVEKMFRTDKQRGHSRKHNGFNERWDSMPVAEQMANGSNLRSVWWISPAQYREGHYAVMPDALAEICITAGCPKGGTVLDPFGGVGTTGLVADRLQRDAILIELNPEYAAMAERRIKSDAPLFTQVATI